MKVQARGSVSERERWKNSKIMVRERRGETKYEGNRPGLSKEIEKTVVSGKRKLYTQFLPCPGSCREPLPRQPTQSAQSHVHVVTKEKGWGCSRAWPGALCNSPLGLAPYNF